MQVKRHANNWLQLEGFLVMRCLDKRNTEMLSGGFNNHFYLWI